MRWPALLILDGFRNPAYGMMPSLGNHFLEPDTHSFRLQAAEAHPGLAVAWDGAPRPRRALACGASG